MKKKLLYLILPVCTLFLELIPYGAVCNFARPATDGSIGRFRVLYSYFDLTPFGYANFSPLITGVITCLALLFLAIYCLSGNEKWMRLTRNTLLVCTIVSVGPLTLGIDFFSLVGALITATLIAELLIIHYHIGSLTQTE